MKSKYPAYFLYHEIVDYHGDLGINQFKTPWTIIGDLRILGTPVYWLN